jgi:hypothetical protein
MALKSSVHPVVILLVWILLIKVNLLGYANAQNAYRPYRPISNIFGSLFRPGVHPGPHLPPGKKQYFLTLLFYQIEPEKMGPLYFFLFQRCRELIGTQCKNDF